MKFDSRQGRWFVVAALLGCASALAQGGQPDDSPINGFIKQELRNPIFQFERQDLTLTKDYAGVLNPKKDPVPKHLGKMNKDEPWQTASFYSIDRRDDIVVRTGADRNKVFEWVTVQRTGKDDLRKTYVQMKAQGDTSYVATYTNCVTVGVDALSGREGKHFQCRSYNGDYCDALAGKDASLESRLKSFQQCETLLEEVTKADPTLNTHTQAAITRINRLSHSEQPIPDAAPGEPSQQTRLSRNAYQQVKRFISDVEFCKANRAMFPPKGQGSGLPAGGAPGADPAKTR
jgi:hypothetical protein